MTLINICVFIRRNIVLGFKKFINEGPISQRTTAFKRGPNMSAKIQRKYGGVIKLIKQKYNFNTNDAVNHIIQLLNVGMDPDSVRAHFDKEISRWYKGQKLDMPSFNL